MNDLHVMPVNDLIEHDFDECVCIPRCEPVQRADGSMGYLYVHHSLDGRQEQEGEAQKETRKGKSR